MASSARRLCEDSFTVARSDFESIIDLLMSGDTSALPHQDLEDLLTGRGMELMRKLLQAHLDARGPGSCNCR